MMSTRNWMLCEVFWVICHISVITCSLVVDRSVQDRVYVNDYCPKMESCAEGAHVMCMYYNSKRVIGPRCANFQNISMTPDLASKLLEVSNEIRSKLAQGTETGKNHAPLPRAYGMFRLKWDTELATFAQVLANQCVLQNDLCRATKRFPNPAQAGGLVRFSIPDWYPISKPRNFSSPGLTDDKLLYSTEVVLKSWYSQKNFVTPSMITNYPDWTLNPYHREGRLYMQLIHGSATHMGCGLSAYTEYAFHDNKAAINYNCVMFICNYSARPMPGTAIYNTVPPVTATSSNKCGCPVGSVEDDACLCQVIEEDDTRQPLHLVQNNQQCPDGEVCEPTVVLLPIFTVEDAPPEKLLTHDINAVSSRRQPIKDAGIFQRERNNLLKNKRRSMAGKMVNKPQSVKNAVQKYRAKENPNRSKNRHMKSVRNRYFDKKTSEMKTKKPVGTNRKDSIFNKAPRFKLPSTQIRLTKAVIVARRDFSSAKQLLNKYLSGKQDKSIKISSKHELTGNRKSNSAVKNKDIQRSDNRNSLIIDSEESGAINDNEHGMNEVYSIMHAPKPIQISKDVITYQIKHTTETFLNTAEQRIINQDVHLAEVSNQKNKKTTNSIIEKNENKLITLLDTLEKEVKHVELRKKDKQIFDAKIRQIYGKVVGNSVNLLDFELNENNSRNKNRMTSDKMELKTKHKLFQEPKEELMFEKYGIKVERPESGMKRHQNKSNYNFRHNLVSDGHNHIDKYDETAGLYKKRFNLRGMKHSEFSHEQLRNRYGRNFGDRKSYNDYDLEKSMLGDIYENMDDENKYQNQKEMPFQHRNHDSGNISTDIFDNRLSNNELGVRNNDHRKINKNYYLSNEGTHNDILSIERRRFYQEKLDNIESRLQNRRHWNKQTKNKQRQTRPIMKTRENQLEYRHGNARYEHGYR